MSDQDPTYDAVVSDMRAGAEAIFREHALSIYRANSKDLHTWSLGERKDLYVFTKSQLVTILQLAFASGVESSLERQLLRYLSDDTIPPDQS